MTNRPGFRYASAKGGWLMLFIIGCAIVVGRLGATTVLPPPFVTAVQGSDYIVHAVVTAVKAEKRMRGTQERIYTRVELRVLEAVAGDVPERVVLEFLGGRIGDRVLAVEGMPQFKIGDEDILLVHRNGRALCPLYGMMYGRYPVLRAEDGRRVVTRNDGTVVRHTAALSLPLASHAAMAGRSVAAGDGLTAEEFVREIRAVRASGNEVKHAR